MVHGMFSLVIYAFILVNDGSFGYININTG
jgi:hypothetical protein